MLSLVEHEKSFIISRTVLVKVYNCRQLIKYKTSVFYTSIFPLYCNREIELSCALRCLLNEHINWQVGESIVGEKQQKHPLENASQS